MGTCKSDGPVFTDYIIESCSEFWHKLQRVQIVAVVLAGIVMYAKLLFSSAILIGSRMSVQNFAFCGISLHCPHGQNGTQQKICSD